MMTYALRFFLAAGSLTIACTGLPIYAQEFDETIGSVPEGTGVAAQTVQIDAPYFVMSRQIPNSDGTFALHFVETRDESYIPLGIRKPEGEGPFPVILMGSGNGNDGVSKIDRSMYRLEPMMDRMIARGYAVAYGNYRNEIPSMYNEIDRTENVLDTISGGSRALKSTATLDSDDYISLIEHLKALPYTDPEGVGTFGVSHTGELMHKAASVIDFGAAVASEGASYEFLVVDADRALREGRVMMLQDKEIVRSLADKEKAMARIRNIDTPFLHLGRDEDHLQGVFLLAHEWLVEAGKDSAWVSFDHPVHGYPFHYRKEDGSYAPDEIQEQAFEITMAFFDKHLKGADITLTRAND